MAIADDWTIDYTNDRIVHTSGTTVYTVNALYSYLMNTFDESEQMDELIPMTAQTPREYTLTNGWFMDETSMHYLNEGAIETVGWDGEIQILDSWSAYVDAVESDIGKTVQDDGVDAGPLLAYDNTAQKWWVRASSTIASGSSITITGGSSGTRTTSADSKTGENLWVNVYTLGAIESNTDIYVIQSDAKISSWWPSGHIDILTLVREAGTEIEGAEMTILARQYSKLYGYSELDASGGGRNPIPLATLDDFNNATGYRTVNFDNGNASTLAVDDVISVDGTARAVVTSVTDGGAASGSFRYYLIGNLTDFSDNDSFTASPSGKTGYIDGAATDYGPAASPDNTITITFGATSQDIDNGNGLRPYDVTIDCQQIALSDVYERLKYVTRRGEETIQLNGHDGELYRAVGDIRLPYDTQTGNFTEGLTVTGGSSGATGVVVADHDAGTTGALILRDVEGTFDDDEIITDTSTGSATTNIPSGAITISPTKTAPFGTFAGGKLFGARGVFLDDLAGADAANYELVDSEGVRQVPPASVPITVNGLVSGDRVSVFRATGSGEGADKTYLSSHASANTSGSTTFTTTATIPLDTPSSGVLRVVDTSTKTEQRYSYTSYSGAVFSGIVKLFGTLDAGLDRDYETGDAAYVPYLDEESTGSSISTSVTYVTDRFLLTRVRIKGIVPYSIPGQLTSTGYSVTAIRNPDDIVT